MQEQTKREMREVKAVVNRVLEQSPDTRGNDDALYYHVCRERALDIGVDIRALHFATVFMGNPLGFPRYESVVRMRRMIQRQQPELQAENPTKRGRSRKEADYIEMARKKGNIPQ